MKGEQPPDAVAIDAWWKAIMAGGVDEPHPVHGDDLKISIRHGVLRLVGTMPTEDDKRELLGRAREYVGHGIDKVDARRLKVFERKEKPGILEQTLIADFANRDVAEIATRHLVDIRRLKAKQIEILDREQRGQDAPPGAGGFHGERREGLQGRRGSPRPARRRDRRVPGPRDARAGHAQPVDGGHAADPDGNGEIRWLRFSQKRMSRGSVAQPASARELTRQRLSLAADVARGRPGPHHRRR